MSRRRRRERAMLDFDAFPMRLYAKGQRLGMWDPMAIDLSRDRVDWHGLDSRQRLQVLYFISGFEGGEEAVLENLAPLMLYMSRRRRMEEETYLTSFLFEEAKHFQFFHRWLDLVADSPDDLELLRFPAWRALFEQELPLAMGALVNDDSPAALARAVVSYNLIAEGVMAETGYHAYHRALAARGLMPGLCEALVHVKRDEARHIAFGVYLLTRLVREERDIWAVIEEHMTRLFPKAVEMIREGFRLTPPEQGGFGLEEEEFVGFATRQFRLRFERVRRATGTQSMTSLQAELEHEAFSGVS